MTPASIPQWLEQLFLQPGQILILLDRHGVRLRETQSAKELTAPQNAIPLQPVLAPGNDGSWIQWILIPFDDSEFGQRLWSGTRQSQLSELQELRVREQHKDQFISFAAHQLRNPIASVFSWTELLQNHVLVSEAERDEAYKIIAGESQQLSSQLTKLLNYLRLESGRMQFEIREILVEELLQRCSADVQQLANSQFVTLFIENDFPEACISSDLAMASLALVQIIENAIENSLPNGEVLIQVSLEEELVTIRVQDSGQGIPEAIQRQVLSTFPLPQPGSGPRKGLGLGLPTAAEILVKIHGKLELNSIQGKGTSVAVSLPMVSRH